MWRAWELLGDRVVGATSLVQPRESREVAVESPGGHVTEPGRERLRCRVGRASRGRAVPSVPRTRNSGAPPRPSLRARTQAPCLLVDATDRRARTPRAPPWCRRRRVLPCGPLVVSLGRQLLRHRLRQQPRHPLPLVVAHRADDHLQPLRRHAAFLTSGCGRGMRLWGQKYQTRVNAAFMTKN